MGAHTNNPVAVSGDVCDSVARVEGAICEPIVELEGVGYRYRDGQWANTGIDLKIHRGELFCLLGPNGAGKSTLIKQLIAVLRPTRGCIRYRGQEIHKNPELAKRHMGIIPQDVGLFDQLTVGEHLSCFYPLKGVRQRPTAEMLRRLMQKTGLADLGARKIGSLSTGQRRRVLFALALIGDPECLVLDEPTVALDPEARRAMWAVIRAEKRAGKTVILTTHYMDEAERLADRIGIIENGTLSYLGTVDELFRRTARTVKVTEVDPESGVSIKHHFFDTLADAQRFVQARNMSEYYIGRVGLEDVYVEVVRSPR